MYLKDFRKCYCCEEKLHYSQFKVFGKSETNKIYYSKFICDLCYKEISKLPKKARNNILNSLKEKRRIEEKKPISIRTIVIV